MGAAILMIILLALIRLMTIAIVANHLKGIKKSFDLYTQNKSYITERDYLFIKGITDYLSRKKIKNPKKNYYLLRKFLNSNRTGYFTYGWVKIIGTITQLFLLVIAVGVNLRWTSSYNIQEHVIEAVIGISIVVITLMTLMLALFKQNGKTERDLIRAINESVDRASDGTITIRQLPRQRRHSSISEINGLDEILGQEAVTEDEAASNESTVADLEQIKEEKQTKEDQLKVSDIEIIISQISK